MQRAFDHFEELEMLGGCIYVGDQLVGLYATARRSTTTPSTPTSKRPTPSYDGAFTIINKLFAEHLPERFTLINREEDLGIDGLRQSETLLPPRRHPAQIHGHTTCTPTKSPAKSCGPRPSATTNSSSTRS